MSRDREILQHLVDIKEDVASLKATLVDYPEVKQMVQKNTVEITKTRTQIKTVKWLAGLLLVTIPSTVAAWIRITKG